jgi:hypothetical protein
MPSLSPSGLSGNPVLPLSVIGISTGSLDETEKPDIILYSSLLSSFHSSHFSFPYQMVLSPVVLTSEYSSFNLSKLLCPLV